MAPTTLIGQPTGHQPLRPQPASMGQPMRMAEMIAGLDGPVYVERVALFDNKQRVKAEKAIKKALQLQVESKGFAFVEVLAECPTHLGLTPRRDREVGQGEDAAGLPAGREEGRRRREPWSPGSIRRPSTRDAGAARSVGGQRRAAAALLHTASRASFGPTTSPSSWPASGGDGAQTAAMLIAAPPSTRASTPPTSRATARSRAAARPTPTCTWPRTRCCRRPRRTRTCWWPSTPPAWPSSARRWRRAASWCTTAP